LIDSLTTNGEEKGKGKKKEKREKKIEKREKKKKGERKPKKKKKGGKGGKKWHTGPFQGCQEEGRGRNEDNRNKAGTCPTHKKHFACIVKKRVTVSDNLTSQKQVTSSRAGP